jgi:transcriptional regulator with XRE-family HTH domain
MDLSIDYEYSVTNYGFKAVSYLSMKFSDWIVERLNERGWSRSEAAKRGGISPSMFDKVINETSSPGITFCKGIALAFDIPPEEVLRQAGLLPPQPETDPVLDELNYKLASLPIELREEALEYLNYLIEKQDRKARGTNGLKNNLGTTHAT